MTPWYGTTAILLAAQLNKKFLGSRDGKGCDAGWFMVVYDP